MMTAHIGALVLLLCRAHASVDGNSVVRNLTQLRLGMPYAQLQRLRPGVHPVGSEDVAASTAPLSMRGKALAVEAIADDPWFASAMYGIEDGHLVRGVFVGERAWTSDEFLRRRNGLIADVISVMGIPSKKAVLTSELPHSQIVDVPLLLWHQEKTVLFLMLPTAQHGRYAYMTYSLQFLRAEDSAQYLAKRKAISEADCDTFFSAAGLKVATTRKERHGGR